MNKPPSNLSDHHAKSMFLEWTSELFKSEPDIYRDSMFSCIAYYATEYIECFLGGERGKATQQLSADLLWLHSEVEFFKYVDMNSPLRSRYYKPLVEFRFTLKLPGERRSFADWLSIKAKVYKRLLFMLLEHQNKSKFEISDFFFELSGNVERTKKDTKCSNEELHTLIKKCRANIGIAAECLDVTRNAIRKRLLRFVNAAESSSGQPKLKSLPKDWPLRLYGIVGDSRTRRRLDIVANKELEKLFSKAGSEVRSSKNPSEKRHRKRRRCRPCVTDAG